MNAQFDNHISKTSLRNSDEFKKVLTLLFDAKLYFINKFCVAFL